MVFSLLRSADEPGIISHVDGTEIDVLTVHLADDERKTGTTATTTTSQTFAVLSWSECAGHALLGGVINVVLVQCAQSLSAYITLPEMHGTLVTRTSCALNHIG